MLTRDEYGSKHLGSIGYSQQPDGSWRKPSYKCSFVDDLVIPECVAVVTDRIEKQNHFVIEFGFV